MSRVADALRRAAGASPNPPEIPVVPEATDDTVANPWAIGSDNGPASISVFHPRPATAIPRHGAGRPTEYEDLVQRLFRPGSDEPIARTLLVVDFEGSGASGEVVVGLVRTLSAHEAGSVCVVDASFGTATLSDRLEVPVGPGFCDAILSSAPAVPLAAPLAPDLWVVQSGAPMLEHPAAVAAAAARTLRQIAARFDFVVAAASTTQTSAATLAAMSSVCDGVVLVIDSEHTRRDDAAALVARLKEGGTTTVLGAVLRAPHS
jgi:hypothetical protein